VQPAVDDRLSGFLGSVQIAAHDVGAPYDQLAALSDFHFFSCIVFDPKINSWTSGTSEATFANANTPIAKLTSIENIVGTSGSDVLIGDVFKDDVDVLWPLIDDLKAEIAAEKAVKIA